jgi:hypothetical protein
MIFMMDLLCCQKEKGCQVVESKDYSLKIDQGLELSQGKGEHQHQNLRLESGSGRKHLKLPLFGGHLVFCF